MTRLAVIGLGKMGLPVATYYAARGARVTGIDIDAGQVAAINAGQSPVGREPGMDEELAGLVASGRLRATTSYSDGLDGAEVVIVLVPLLADAGVPDFASLDAATAAMAPHLGPETLVIYETTLPVGATRNRFTPVVRERHDAVPVAFSPERVSSGRTWRDLDTYPKLVGGIDDASRDRAVAFYRAYLPAEVRPLQGAEAAELVKLAETTYRDLNIAFANELAKIAADWDVDVDEIIAGANSQPYSHIHQPGIGVGGHCIPHYPWLLQRSSVGSELILASRRINDGMPGWVLDRAEKEIGPLTGATIVALGVAYRPGVPEAASSPVFGLRDQAATRGARLVAADPLFAPDRLRDLGLEPWEGDAPDVLVLVTAHPEYRDLDLSGYAPMLVIDGRNALDPARVAQAGHRYVGVGRTGLPATEGIS